MGGAGNPLLSTRSTRSYRGRRCSVDATFAALGTDLSGLISKGGEWIQAIWDGAVSIWNSTLTWIGGLSADALEWIGDTSSTLLDKGGDLLNGLLNGAVSTWETISTWVASIPSKAVDFVGDVTSTLLQKDSTCYTVSMTDRSRPGMSSVFG